MTSLFDNFEEYILNSNWGDIAKMVRVYSLEFSNEDDEVLTMLKKLRITKELLYLYLNDEDKTMIKNATFFRGVVKSIDYFELNLKKHPVKKSEFIVFLKALSKKIGKEKLIIYKVMERREEFGRLKDEVYVNDFL